jgi:hypothetical protein
MPRKNRNNHKKTYKHKTHNKKHYKGGKKHNKTRKIYKRNNVLKKSKNNQNKNKNIKHLKMKGGNANLDVAYSQYSETVPFLPHGRPFIPGEVNGLGNGHYYSLASDLHAPNDAIVNTSLHGNIGPYLTSQTGGRKNKSRKNRLSKSNKTYKTNKYYKGKGGGLVPQDIIDLGRHVTGGIKSIYSGFVGTTNPDSNNPNPTFQPTLEKPSELNITPPNIPEMMEKADLQVATM